MGQMQTEAQTAACYFLLKTSHAHIDTEIHARIHTHTHAHKFKKCNIPLTEMTIYWWFLLFAIYFNSARKCIADVTPSVPTQPAPSPTPAAPLAP